MLTSLLIASAALSQPSLETCRVIDVPAERLACYDRLAGREEAAPEALALEAAAPRSTLAAPKSEEELKAEFEAKRELVKSGDAPAIYSDITEIVVERTDHLTIILDNGQVWRQLSSDRPIRVNSKKPPKTVTITEAAMGSYRLKLDDSRQSIRVRRVK